MVRLLTFCCLLLVPACYPHHAHWHRHGWYHHHRHHEDEHEKHHDRHEQAEERQERRQHQHIHVPSSRDYQKSRPGELRPAARSFGTGRPSDSPPHETAPTLRSLTRPRR